MNAASIDTVGSVKSTISFVGEGASALEVIELGDKNNTRLTPSHTVLLAVLQTAPLLLPVKKPPFSCVSEVSYLLHRFLLQVHKYQAETMHRESPICEHIGSKVLSEH